MIHLILDQPGPLRADALRNFHDLFRESDYFKNDEIVVTSMEGLESVFINKVVDTITLICPKRRDAHHIINQILTSINYLYRNRKLRGVFESEGQPIRRKIYVKVLGGVLDSIGSVQSYFINWIPILNQFALDYR